ncbi:hypothetical protein HF086_008681 [Spodoptera exigua]|uniref:Uncharacterized protein n=1 Tax=Spodoptera exigua TaxID=7107 RepID=A0A922SMQ8_SPOEX|nr:hypothetical protein HF086_008681 [Spodoptera exigua]
MAESSKKRGGSFRKIFPKLFFSHKSKEKSATEESKSNAKGTTESSKGNQYQNPRSIRSDKNGQGLEDNERIYENLTTRPQSDNETQSNDISSHHSSSSTLVSESTKNKSIDTNEISEAESFAYTNYTARPQVPPKPFNEMAQIPHSPHSSNRSNQVNNFDNTQYPDVYYHSLEKLNDKISPFDEIEIYRASQAQTNPASVGAEIKRVSTKFLISPKKEAEVRTIQPTRARSLSFDNNKENEQAPKEHTTYKRQESSTKPYNYSAPTSPMPISHKMPNMPKTVSPYEHVRKTMLETEEKRNSLSRTSLRNKSSPSPRSEYSQRTTPTLPENSRQDSSDKEKTRQKVEAFYWQKLKELKQKEDEYLIRQSLNTSLKSPSRFKPSANSNCSTPNSFSYVIEPRSCSLPRGHDLQSYSTIQSIYTSVPFARGAPERRTDTFIKFRNTVDDPDIIYRHPEKLMVRTASPAFQEQKMPMYFRSMPQDGRSVGPSKRVSFEERYGKTESIGKNNSELKVNDYKVQSLQPGAVHKISEISSRVPPRPPVRTTSVGGKKVVTNKKITQLTSAGQSLCSESESGSEAGEIQRIMQGNVQKGKCIHVSCLCFTK